MFNHTERRNECLSLGFRMNAAGWVHNSFYERNIVKQPGPLNKSPTLRRMNEKYRNGYGVDWSFRVVDFGRTRHKGDVGGRPLKEEMAEIKYWWESKTTYWE